MRALPVIAVVSLSVLGCKKKEEPQPVAVNAPVHEATPVAEEAEVADAGGPLTLAEVDAWVTYRNTLADVHRKLLPELDKLEAQARKSKDGGVAEQGLKLVGEEAKAQEQARKASGLSQAQVERIEAMVQELVAEREMAEDTADPAELAEMEALAKKSAPDQKAALEKSIADLKAQRERSLALTDLRAEFGDSDVNVLLQRDEAVRKAWKGWMSALSGETAAK